MLFSILDNIVILAGNQPGVYLHIAQPILLRVIVRPRNPLAVLAFGKHKRCLVHCFILDHFSLVVSRSLVLVS